VWKKTASLQLFAWCEDSTEVMTSLCWTETCSEPLVFYQRIE
jgi:hypothetical protein